MITDFMKNLKKQEKSFDKFFDFMQFQGNGTSVLPLYGLRYLRFGAAVVPGIFRIASFPIPLIRQRYGLGCLQKSGKVSDFIIYEINYCCLKRMVGL